MRAGGRACVCMSVCVCVLNISIACPTKLETISAEYVTQLPQTSELDSFGGLFCDFLSWIQT